MIASIISAIISFIFFISLIFLMVGSTKIKNKQDSGNLFITQMPYEILSNHRLNVIYDVKFQSICPSNYHNLNLRLKLDSYYDCTDVKNDELKESCQNEIVSNITCCENRYCVGLTFNSSSSISIQDYIRSRDPRSKYCEYFNRYKGDVFSLYNNYLCVQDPNESKNEFPPVYNYKELVSYAKPPGTTNCGENLKPCGILDTIGNILCFPKNYKCPLNSIIISSPNNNNLLMKNHIEYKMDDTLSIYFGFLESTTDKIIVENYISEIPILSHEWDKFQNDKFSSLNIKKFNKIKYKYDKYSSKVTIEKNSLNSDFYLTVKDIIEWNQKNCNFLKEYTSKNINLNQNLEWYTKYYIGVNLNEKSYNDIISIFEDDEKKNNKFYKKYYSRLQPGKASLVCTAVFICIYYIIFVILFLVLKCKGDEMDKICDIVLNSVQFTYELIYFIIFLVKYVRYKKLEKIKNDFDEQINDLINVYLLIIKEIKIFCYMCFIIIIIHFIAIIVILFCLCREKWKNEEKEKQEEKKNTARNDPEYIRYEQQNDIVNRIYEQYESQRKTQNETNEMKARVKGDTERKIEYLKSQGIYIKNIFK